VLTRSLEHGGFGIDHAHQIVPGIDERFGAFFLKLFRQCVNVDPRPGELCQFLLVIAVIRR